MPRPLSLRFSAGRLEPATVFFGAFFVVFSALPAARASLGGNRASVDALAQSMASRPATIAQARGYEVHEISTQRHVVREFVAPDGSVFAVSWKGRVHPDATVLMGAYFERFKQSVALARATHHGHGPMSGGIGDFRFELGGHARAVRGRAWLSGKLPPGVSTNELR
jgi:hypothetical protein